MPKKVLYVFLTVFFIFLAAGQLSCQAQRSSGEVGTMASEFDLNDLDGKPFKLADLKGNVVILDFWATWCPPCRMEIPHFESLYRAYRNEGLVVVGISLDRGGARAVKRFIEKNEMTYPVLIGDAEVTNDYGGIRGIPTTFIIDREGRITGKYVGYRDKAFFEAAIKKLL